MRAAMKHPRVRALLAAAVLLATASVATLAGLWLSGEFGSRAVQTPEISLDMNPTGNTYDDTTNSMTVGATESCMSTNPGNNATHTHVAHLVIRNVEDLYGWQVRLNYDGGKMRPSTVNFGPFTDNNTSQTISFQNLPIDANSLAHRDQFTVSQIPPQASGPQTALLGNTYQTKTIALSPDTPAKSTPDDNSYSAPNGGVLAAITLQVLAGNSGRVLSMDLDDANPNRPGSKALIFTGTGQQTINLSESALGDGFHAEGVPWNVPPNDADCDGFSTTVENSVGTDPNRPCGTDAWPPDINNDGYVDVIGDISRVTADFSQSVPPGPARYDMAPDPPDHFIDVIGDITRMTGLYSLSCN
jgi:hypothetical protein